MIDNDQDGDGYGYLRQGFVTDPRPFVTGDPAFPLHAGPYSIVWKTGYPQALDCYFWFYTNNQCNSPYSNRSVARYWLFSCEDGSLVNRTNDAVTSARHSQDSADITVTNTAFGYAIEDEISGDAAGEPYCPTDAEDMPPLEPELIC
jgi:hypothetical protein